MNYLISWITAVAIILIFMRGCEMKTGYDLINQTKESMEQLQHYLGACETGVTILEEENRELKKQLEKEKTKLDEANELLKEAVEVIANIRCDKENASAGMDFLNKPSIKKLRGSDDIR